MAILLGMPFLVLFMLTVMGLPYAYYLARDARYEASKSLPGAERLRIWYNH